MFSKNGFLPALFNALTSAPALTKMEKTMLFPRDPAQCNGVKPSLSRMLISAPSLIKIATNSLLYPPTARCKGVAL